MVSIPAPDSRELETAKESPVSVIQEQMLMLKKSHFGEGVSLSPADKMEANRISGLPLARQLAAYNEWAIKLAQDTRKESQEQIAASTRSQVELAAKLEASEKKRELSDYEAVKWKGLAHVDPLLEKALNKRALYEELQKIIEEVNSGRQIDNRENQLKRFAVLFLDLDHFKMINTKPLNHLIGDKALREFFTLIRRNIRGNDIIGRYGGEEFVIILPGANAEQAAERAERIRTAVERGFKEAIMNHCLEQDQKKRVNELDGTVSIGVTDYDTNDPELNVEELLLKANQAMHHSKSNGRNQVTVYDPKKITGKDKRMA